MIKPNKELKIFPDNDSVIPDLLEITWGKKIESKIWNTIFNNYKLPLYHYIIL